MHRTQRMAWFAGFTGCTRCTVVRVLQHANKVGFLCMWVFLRLVYCQIYTFVVNILVFSANASNKCAAWDNFEHQGRMWSECSTLYVESCWSWRKHQQNDILDIDINICFSVDWMIGCASSDFLKLHLLPLLFPCQAARQGLLQIWTNGGVFLQLYAGALGLLSCETCCVLR